MGKPTLEGVDLKLNRAADRFDALVKATAEFLADQNTYEVGIEQHPKARGFLLRVKKVERPPISLSLLIGECVQQYRSALDHLAFQLLIANTRGRLPTKLVKRSEFPIFNSGRRFRGHRNRKGEPSSGSGWAKIEGIAPEAQTIIEALQPYHRRKNPRSRALLQLQELSNIDKHRVLHVTVAALRGSSIEIQKTLNVSEINPSGFEPGPLKRDAVIATVEVIPSDPSKRTETKMQPELLTDIAFTKGGPARSIRGEPVLPMLAEIGEFVFTEVVSPLADLIGLPTDFKPRRLVDARELSPSERQAFKSHTQDLSLESRQFVVAGH